MSINELISSLETLTEQDLREFFASAELQKKLQNSMLRFTGGNVYEWMTSNKLPWCFWAFLYRVINNRMSIAVTLNTGVKAFISPTPDQFVKDGITFLQGEKQMEGLLCCYKEGKISVASLKRDVLPGETLGADDFQFVELDENGKLPGNVDRSFSFSEAEEHLRSNIKGFPEDESKFQDYFKKYPWVFGLEYKEVQSHQRFDDSNIPDFSAVKMRNNLRDIIEIKPPGLRVFGKDRKPLAAFHEAFSQCERYIDFADKNSDYLLREKGLRFDSPTAILVAGYDLMPECMAELRRKERLNPRIKIYTYNDILVSIASMKDVIKALHSSTESKPG